MEKTKLELGFLDSKNKKFNLSLEKPKDGLGLDKIKSSMEKLVELNIFDLGGERLVGVLGAKKIITRVEKYEF